MDGRLFKLRTAACSVLASARTLFALDEWRQQVATQPPPDGHHSHGPRALNPNTHTHTHTHTHTSAGSGSPRTFKPFRVNKEAQKTGPAKDSTRTYLGRYLHVIAIQKYHLFACSGQTRRSSE